MSDLGELIGGIMAGLNRARRDADVASAIIAEEYRIHSLLSAVSAPRVRLSEVEIDLPVILSSPQGEGVSKKSGVVMTHSAVLQTLVSRLHEMGLEGPITTAFIEAAEPELALLFGDEVRGVSGESISRVAQTSITSAYKQNAEKGSKEVETSKRSGKKKSTDDGSSKEENQQKTSVDSARNVLDLESRRIGRELTSEWPRIEAVAETQAIRDLGSEASITRVKLKLIEEGLEWTTTKDEDGNRINRLVSE